MTTTSLLNDIKNHEDYILKNLNNFSFFALNDYLYKISVLRNNLKLILNFENPSEDDRKILIDDAISYIKFNEKILLNDISPMMLAENLKMLKKESEISLKYDKDGAVLKQHIKTLKTAKQNIEKTSTNPLYYKKVLITEHYNWAKSYYRVAYNETPPIE